MVSGFDYFIMYTNWWMIRNATLFQLTMTMDDIARNTVKWPGHDDISTDLDVWILDHGSYLTLGGYPLLSNWRMTQAHQGYRTNMAINHRWDFQMLFIASTNLIHISFQFLYILQMTPHECCNLYNTSHRNANGLVVLCFVLLGHVFYMYSYDWFSHILWGCFINIGQMQT